MEVNTDINEVNKFSSGADEWWDLTGPYKTLHMINPLRVEFIKQNTKLENTRILDVGCGAGILSEALAKAYTKVTGIDASEKLISAAQKHAKQNGLEISYAAANIEEYAKDSKDKFDIITCMELLEHVPDPASIIASCAYMLKPGGKFFCSTLNKTPKAYFAGILAAEYILKLLPKGTHKYNKFIRPSVLTDITSKNNLMLKNITGISYNIFTERFSLSKDVAINYITCFEKNS